MQSRLTKPNVSRTLSDGGNSSEEAGSNGLQAAFEEECDNVPSNGLAQIKRTNFKRHVHIVTETESTSDREEDMFSFSSDGTASEDSDSPSNGEVHSNNNCEIPDNNGPPVAVRLPSFQRRPLSDTPVTSNWNSPGSSADSTPLTSPETSSNNLTDLNTENVITPITTTNTTVKNTAANTPDADSTITNINRKNNDTGKINNIHTTLKVPSNKHLVNNNIGGAVSPSKFSHPRKRPATIDVPGLTKSKTSPDGTISKDDTASKLVIVMVGLPATGKSFITNKLSRFLNFSMYDCKAFNVGNTRRKYAKEHGLQDQDSKFFDSTNKTFTKLREQWAIDTLDELLDYLLNSNGCVAIFDATNSTKDRRKHIVEKIRARSQHLEVLFLETICSDKTVVEENIRLKLFGPDYKGKDPKKSLQDFKERLVNYKKAYETLEDDEALPYIKMIDVSKKVITYRIQGFLASQAVYYLLNFTLQERQIWITRNGESEDNVLGRIGGDSHLTSRGDKYARALAKFMDEQRTLFSSKNNKRDEADDELCNEFFVWTSMRARCIETAQYFDDVDYPLKQMKMLDELNAGDFEGMTYPEIQSKHPEEFEERTRDKLRYRYPGIGGESYMDVINRLRSVITEIERLADNVLIITHRVAARVLLGYFMNLGKDIITNLDVPLHCIYCLDLKPYGISWSLWEYDEKYDSFFKVPQSVLNTTKVKEIGFTNNERHYSIVPTAPISSASSISDIEPKRRSSMADPEMNTLPLTPALLSHTEGQKSTTDSTTVYPSAHLINGGGTSITSRTARQPLKPEIQQEHNITKDVSYDSKSSTPNEKDEIGSKSTSKKKPSPRQLFEIDKLDEKLAQLKSNFSKQKSNKSSPYSLKLTRSHSHE